MIQFIWTSMSDVEMRVLENKYTGPQWKTKLLTWFELVEDGELNASGTMQYFSTKQHVRKNSSLLHARNLRDVVVQ